MLKLQQLKKKQAETKTPSTEESPSSTNTPDFLELRNILKRQNSKELAETRKQKSKENVFTLRRSGTTKKGGKKKRKIHAELRVHKGKELLTLFNNNQTKKDISEMDPIPGTRLNFQDPDNLMTFKLYITPTNGFMRKQNLNLL